MSGANANSKRTTAIALSLFLFGSVALQLSRPGVAIGESTTKTDVVLRLNEVIETEVARGFSGSVLVARGQEVLLEKGYGVLHGRAIDSDARFIIASVSKQFVSAALLKLQERGLVRLDDTLGTLFTDAPADKRAITIRQLLAHASGLPQAYASEEATTWQEAVEAIFKEKLTAKPGERYQYSNENFQLGGAIVEKVSRRAYVEFVRTELLHPAGLRNTDRVVPGTIATLTTTVRPLPERLFHLKWGVNGYYSTAHDLFSWYRSLITGQILSASSVRELFAPVVPAEDGQMALAWFLGKTPDGTQYVYTRGFDDFGANVHLFAYPERDIVIVVMSHAGSPAEATDSSASQSFSRIVQRRLERILLQTPRS